MTLIQEAIRTRLLSSTAISGQVGSTSNGRIYYLRLPEAGNVPAITYSRVSRIGYPVYNKDDAESRRLTSGRFQVDVWSNTGENAATIAGNVRRQLDGFKGTVSTLDIQGAFLMDEADGYDVETKLYRVRQDFSITHVESS